MLASLHQRLPHGEVEIVLSFVHNIVNGYTSALER